MKLNLQPLRKALGALQKSLTYLNSDLAKDPDLREQFRGAAIQAFEFTHEMVFKMLKRRLRQMAPDPKELDQLTYMEVIREAAKAGLLKDVARFKDYRDKRNISSHTYNQESAESILSVLTMFEQDVRFLLEKLEEPV